MSWRSAASSIWEAMGIVPSLIVMCAAEPGSTCGGDGRREGAGSEQRVGKGKEEWRHKAIEGHRRPPFPTPPLCQPRALSSAATKPATLTVSPPMVYTLAPSDAACAHLTKMSAT